MVIRTAILAKIVRDPRSGEVHVPKERVAILAVIQNLNRTLLKVRWEAGGDCVIFPTMWTKNVARRPIHRGVTRVFTQMDELSRHETVTLEKSEAVSCFTRLNSLPREGAGFSVVLPDSAAPGSALYTPDSATPTASGTLGFSTMKNSAGKPEGYDNQPAS